MTRNQKILALRGSKSFSLIGAELGISRAVVAGVCFRFDHDRPDMVKSPQSSGANKIGRGAHGGAHEYAPVHLCHSGSGRIVTTGTPT